jgi:hypothetical protein
VISGRNLEGELSFRLGDGQKQLDSPPAAAAQMHHCFLALQSLDWCLPESRTKTQVAYGAR